MKSYILSFLFLILSPSCIIAQTINADAQPFQLSIMEKMGKSCNTADENKINMIIPQPAPFAIDLSQTKTKHKGGFGRGAWIGAAIGSTTGGIIGLVTYKPCDGIGCILRSNSSGDSFATGFLIGTISGALIGGITGVIIKLTRKK
jgi:hypothetical protein